MSRLRRCSRCLTRTSYLDHGGVCGRCKDRDSYAKSRMDRAWRDLATLGRNLAIAGALNRSYDLGWERGHAEGDTAVSTTEWRRRIAAEWAPNVAGRTAPGGP